MTPFPNYHQETFVLLPVLPVYSVPTSHHHPKKQYTVLLPGGYQDWFWNEDYYLWIRMWLNGAVFANTGSVLVNVRVGEEMYQRRGGSKYFESEKGLQDYMLKNKMINHSTYIKNVTKRLIIQKLMPNKLRGWVFRTFARKKVS